MRIGGRVSERKLFSYNPSLVKAFSNTTISMVSGNNNNNKSIYQREKEIVQDNSIINNNINLNNINSSISHSEIREPDYYNF